jgi:hypothetical protein
LCNVMLSPARVKRGAEVWMLHLVFTSAPG